MAAAWFGDPARNLELVAVTGTNGKTTTTAVIRPRSILRGTLAASAPSERSTGQKAVPSTAGALTTPGPLDCTGPCRHARARGASRGDGSVTHALHQERLAASVSRAVRSPPHPRPSLDYNGEMDAYREAKLRLGTLVRPDGALSINVADDAWQSLLEDPRAVPGVTIEPRRCR